MKPDTYMQRGIVFIVCLAASLSIWTQTPRKPRMQTSASPAETVYKSWEEMQTELKGKNAVSKKMAQTSLDNTSKSRTGQQASSKNKIKSKNSTRSEGSGSYIALKTNLPFLAVAVQNLAVEVKVHSHISIDFPVTSNASTGYAPSLSSLKDAGG